MKAMQAPRVLHEGSLPRDGHCEKQRIQPQIVETLPDVTTRRDDESALLIGNLGKFCTGLSALARSHAAPEDDQVGHSARELRREVLRVIPPLRKQDGRA